MRKSIQFLLFLVGMSTLYSCASATKAPESKDFEAKKFQSIDDKSVLYIYRTSRALNAGGLTSVMLDAHSIGDLRTGRYFRVEVAPGNHKIQCRTPESSAVVDLNCEAGKIYYFKQNEHIGIETSRVSLKEVSEKKGKEAVLGKKLLVDAYVVQ